MRDQSAISILNIRSITMLADQKQVLRKIYQCVCKISRQFYERVYAEQDVILDALIELDRVDEFSADAGVSELVEKAYCDMQAVASRVLFIAHNVKSTSDLLHEPSVCALPKIILPKFDGNFFNWYSFRNTFVSLVHRNQKKKF